MSEKWRKISIRNELIEEIERIIKNFKHLGYRNVPDFIADAVRRRIEELRKEEQKANP
ncbi:CopG family transcriptional regulator [Candidatus Bathyarchaeota archaeon]|nr:MAG: CopG family transcriptional regulator [Candidatus Bathyarchaeota archaeon]